MEDEDGDLTQTLWYISGAHAMPLLKQPDTHSFPSNRDHLAWLLDGKSTQFPRKLSMPARRLSCRNSLPLLILLWNIRHREPYFNPAISIITSSSHCSFYNLPGGKLCFSLSAFSESFRTSVYRKRVQRTLNLIWFVLRLRWIRPAVNPNTVVSICPVIACPLVALFRVFF